MLTSLPVDLSQKPKANQQPASTLVIGDLHANALKLIFTLQAEGFIQDLDDAHYAALVQAYTQLYIHPEEYVANRESTAQFYEKVKQLKLIARPTKIILLGDDMGDRGARDDLVLAVYQKMAASGLDFEIVYSNHMHALVYATETIQSLLPDQQAHYGYRNIETIISRASLINSMRQLGAAIRNGIVSQTQFIRDYKAVVRPRLKALSYYFQEDTRTLTLFSHAPVGLDTLEKMAESLGLEKMSLISARRVIKVIDQINQRFEAYAKTRQLRRLYEAPDGPFYFSLWNKEEEPYRPHMLKGISLCFIHGHTYGHEFHKIPHALSLNNNLGTRSQQDREGYKGTYAVYKHPVPTTAPEAALETGESSTSSQRRGFGR